MIAFWLVFQAATRAHGRDRGMLIVRALTEEKEGVGIAELTSATKWLPHTTRAAQ